MASIPQAHIAIIGLGKIARDQHLPAIVASPDFELTATVDPNSDYSEGPAHFTSIEELAASDVPVDAVALCMPPQFRQSVAAFAIDQGWHVLLEKPPAATLCEAHAMLDAAKSGGVAIFATWHSVFAPGVEPARRWIAEREIERVEITWKEDVRVWHPGQTWMWRPGGFGVFDSGINALSVAARIFPATLVVEKSELSIPENVATPMAAQVMLRDASGTPISLDLDFLQEGPPTWDIVVKTKTGVLTLSHGGHSLSIDGNTDMADELSLGDEYAAIYRRFAELVANCSTDMDLAPLRLVADIFMTAKTRVVEPFNEAGA